LRAVAAAMVFFHHVGFLTGATFDTRIGAVLARLDVGVPVFFAISGFLLFRPYAAALLDGEPFADRATFLWKRFWRIYPAYWVALFAVIAVVGISSEISNLPLHILLLQIYSGEVFFGGIPQAWSLAVEVSFYLLLPFGVIPLRRLLAGHTVSQRAVLLLGVAAGLVAFSVLWRMAVMGFDWPIRMVLWLPGTIDYFAMGIGLAVVHVWAERREVARPLAAALGRHDLLWWLLAGGILLFAAHELDLARGLDQAPWHNEIYRQACYALIGLTLLIPAVFGPPERGIVRRVLRFRPLALLGMVSYSFYLYHLVVIEQYLDWTNKLSPSGFLDWSQTSLLSWEMLEITVVTFAIATTVAVAGYWLVEKPSQRVSRIWRPWRR
jgi:peptidoglycan/LPS O-acetylase OafA/YrhL